MTGDLDEKSESVHVPDPEEELLSNIPPRELDYVARFLKTFIGKSESPNKEDHIDFKLVLKALPTKVDVYNYFRCETFSYITTDLALIEFHNGDEAQLFKYFDGKTKSRLNKLSGKANITKQ